jgi:subtilase family serine protease
MFHLNSGSQFKENRPLGKRAANALKAAMLAALVLLMQQPAMAQSAEAKPAPGAGQRDVRPLASRHGTVVIPAASRSSAADLGVRAHANVRFIKPELESPSEAPPFPGYAYETPASLACLYHVVAPIRGCNPIETTNTPSGGSQTIAIVDAYDYPTATADLEYFAKQFGLPFDSSKFSVVYAGSSAPAQDPTGGWELEEALDIEYSHAMAPNATLYLVEAKSDSFNDLFAAVLVANNLVSCGHKATCPAGSSGKGEVSMSWGGSEFVGETAGDPFFTTPGVVYFAAAGDSPGVIYPCASPNVVCAGGTSTARDQNTGNLIQEITWTDAGGGISALEPIPRYQASNFFVAYQLGGYRGVPDLSADANPDTGVWIWDTTPYDSTETGWFIVGGTSVATPLLAGIVNSTGHFASSSVDELNNLYGIRNQASYNDTTYGACGYYSGTFAMPGWDLCTGFGSPRYLPTH